MRSCLETICKPYRILFLLVLTCLVSGWTCSGVIAFNTCTGAVQESQITGLTPTAISAETTSALLNVSGSGFVPQSEILWNGNSLPTSMVDSHHLEATITRETFDSFGGTAGGNVLISVRSPAGGDTKDCSNGRLSNTLALDIN